MAMASRVCVIGSGSWGTAAAGLVARNGSERQVVLWARCEEVATSINERHRNPRHLREYRLPANVCSTTDPAGALEGAGAIVVAVPSNHLRGVLDAFAAWVPSTTPVLVLTKGIEPTSHLLMTEVVADVWGHADRIAALSGPNHAEEICLGMVSAAVVAAPDGQLARVFQGLFVCPEFRAYRTSDLRGVEVCAAGKNVIAISCGVCAGWNMGDNAQAVLMTRGLAEMSRVVVACGGDSLTCMGLAGMGDLVATCTSHHSRNRSFGEALAHGATLEGYERATGMVVEGARAARSLHEVAQERHIEMPITSCVHAMLYEGTDIGRAAQMLLERVPNEEFYGIRPQGGGAATDACA